jgi:hypothetical protein
MERPLRFQQSANLAVASRRASERRPADTPVTFVCWSRRIGAFAGQTDITELFELPAWQSAINTRDNLVQAAVARHRAGSARGFRCPDSVAPKIRPLPSSNTHPNAPTANAGSLPTMSSDR